MKHPRWLMAGEKYSVGDRILPPNDSENRIVFNVQQDNRITVLSISKMGEKYMMLEVYDCSPKKRKGLFPRLLSSLVIPPETDDYQRYESFIQQHRGVI